MYILKFLYVEKNQTKLQICKHFDIGLGSLNRILAENSILKTAACFSEFGKQKTIGYSVKKQ